MTATVDPHFYGQGKIRLALITAGVIGAYTWVGDVSAFTLKPTSQQVKHQESYSGQRGLTDYFAVGAELDIDMTLHQFSSENLARVLRSTVVSTTAGTVTDESLGATVAAGDEVYLANPGVSDLVITDSTGTPLTLVQDTDYSIDENFGLVTILNIGSYVQPFKAAYSYRSRSAVGFLTQGQQKYALKYEGVNLADANNPVIVDVYNLAMDIVQQLSLITTGTDVDGMQVSGGALIDTSKPSTGALGQFGSITQVNAT